MPSMGTRPRPSTRQLKTLVEEAIVDAYGESEQRVGFLCMLQEHLACPFTTDVLGLIVTVERIDSNGAEIVAICRHQRHRQRIPIGDLPVPARVPEGWEWIEAYRYWSRGSR
jgi:hypothetical protein